ncbi:MAG: UPF0262 family protein [Proteobacteria bacterium]|nr:UPF0262 family protein [Pseudomonadota bacterium]
MSDNQKILNLFLDQRTVPSYSSEIEHERLVAIADLIHENFFAPTAKIEGPYNLHLRLLDARLLFDIRDGDDNPLHEFRLPLTSFRSIIRDYFIVCESYFEAMRASSPSRIETIDMGRRGVHNEASEMLQERLKGDVDVDFATARRLFTLICVLHIRA